MTDELENEEKNKDSSKPHNLVTAEKHAESPTSVPKLHFAASSEEVRLEWVLSLLLPHAHALPL